jgi:dsDNA-specific endonuclease/ATPase MutS2
MNEYCESDEPIQVPIEDTIDLHTFLPKEVPSLLEEYLSECVHSGIFEVRIIHGKGKGFLREKVHSCLRKSPHVESFRLGDQSSGEWGATIATLKRI